MEIRPLLEGGEIIQPLGDRILGRTALEDVIDPLNNETICKATEEVSERVRVRTGRRPDHRGNRDVGLYLSSVHEPSICPDC